MDEFVVGESVFLKEIAGVHTIIDYYPDTDRYAVQTPEKSAAPIKVPRDDLLKVSTDILERIRQEVLVGVEQKRVKDEEPKVSSRYTDDQVLIARRRARVVEPLYSIEKAGNKITKPDKEQAMAKLEIKMTVLNDLLAKYRKWSSWESLVPGKSGRRKGATRFDQEVEAIMATASKEDVTGPGGTVQAGINGVQARCLEKNKKPPSPATIRRRHRQNISAREAVANDAGPKVARDIYDTYDHGAVTTHALQIIHADNSPLDCHATDPETGRWLGRPNLTLIVDDHTDSYLGFALTFRASSRNTLADAMLMAIQPKDALMREFGLEGKFLWMQYGAGENYRVDKGSDLNAKTVLAGLDKHGIIPQQRIRPQSGGKVERAFGKINPLFMQRLRGAIASNRKMRRGENPQSMATYNLTDLFILIITQICIWHEFRGSDQLTPNERWLKSFGRANGVIRVPRRIPDPKHFWIDILHEYRCSVSRGGLRTIELIYEVGPYKNKVGTPVRLKIDHNNIHHAWVEFEGKWEEVQLLNNRNADIPKTMWAWDIKRKHGPKAGQLTILGQYYVNIQRHIITDTQQRRLEESRQLQERVLSSLSPGLVNKAPQPKEPTDLATTTTKGSHVSGIPHGRSTSQHRGPAPPMMGDDDL
ncbi:integrase [Pseudomonas brassicacearum]|uniref:integrase n=1 Tax=Pseudomonas brassicacearum TaxID=930166 RepID=UPI0039E10B5C